MRGARARQVVVLDAWRHRRASSGDEARRGYDPRIGGDDVRPERRARTRDAAVVGRRICRSQLREDTQCRAIAPRLVEPGISRARTTPVSVGWTATEYMALATTFSAFSTASLNTCIADDDRHLVKRRRRSAPSGNRRKAPLRLVKLRAATHNAAGVGRLSGSCDARMQPGHQQPARLSRE